MLRGQIIIPIAISNIYEGQILCERADIKQILTKINYIDKIGQKPVSTLCYTYGKWSVITKIDVLMPGKQHHKISRPKLVLDSLPNWGRCFWLVNTRPW